MRPLPLPLPLLALLLLVGTARTGRTQGLGRGTGPGSYLSLHGELSSRYPGEPFTTPAGMTVDWGSFQNRFVATGSRLGVSRADPSLGLAIFFGGGGQFHLPVTEQWMVIPRFDLGYRLAESGGGLLMVGGVGGAYRWSRAYAGVEAETHLYAQGARKQVFPGNVSASALAGFYY
ncbi:MAG: hypothetical protein RL199_941 [Pseudomonadota bacterium]|jgi:hypothetical protein